MPLVISILVCASLLLWTASDYDPIDFPAATPQIDEKEYRRIYREDYRSTIRDNYDRHFGGEARDPNGGYRGNSTLEALAYLGGTSYGCQDQQVALNRSLQDRIRKQLETIAASALILHLEGIVNTEDLSQSFEQDITEADWKYLYPEDADPPKKLTLIGHTLEATDFDDATISSKLSTDISQIMLLAPITNISVKDQDLGSLTIESNTLSVNNVKVGRLYVNIASSGQIVDIEAEDIIWTSDGAGSGLAVKNLKAERINISLTGSGSHLTIDGFNANSSNIRLAGTASTNTMRNMDVAHLNYVNSGTGSYTRIEDSSFENLWLVNRGTGGTTHLFGVTSDLAIIDNTATGANIFMNDMRGEQVLFAHSDGTGGALVGNDLSYPVIQVSNQSTGAVIFLNQVQSDLLITCNTGSSTSKEFITSDRHNYNRDNDDAYDKPYIDGYNFISSQMRGLEGEHETDINDLNTKVLIIFNSGRYAHGVRARGTTEILIAPKGLSVDGLDYHQRIDFESKQHSDDYKIFHIAYSRISTPFDGDHNRASLEEMRRLMKSIDDPSVTNHQGNTPAHLAAQFDFSEEIAQLKNRGANLNARNRLGYTPLVLAIIMTNYNAIEALLEDGACLDSEPVYGRDGDTLAEYLNKYANAQQRNAIFDLIGKGNWPRCPRTRL